MYGENRASAHGVNQFGGIYYDHNKRELDEFLAKLPKSGVYLLYEYDVNGNPYNNGTPIVCI
jgi:hypothetical protein